MAGDFLDLADEGVVGEQGDDGDGESGGGGDEGLGDAAGDGFGIFDAGTAEQVERDNDAGDGAEDAEQRRKGDDGVEHGEAPFHFFDFEHGGGFQGLDKAIVAVCQPGGQDSGDEAFGSFTFLDGGIEIAGFG